ncbi:MAG: hypothetical protein NTU48_03040 [Legionellales bacterium]|nr:hypothetical protein [Legionellales bacterium]
MKERLDTLNHQLTLVGKFETLFNSRDLETFKQNLGNKQKPNTFISEIDSQKTRIAFDDFKFQATDARIANIDAAITLFKQIFPADQKGLAELDKLDSEARVFYFFNLAIGAMLRPPIATDTNLTDIIFMVLATWTESPGHNPTLTRISTMLTHIRSLITQQKNMIEKEISAALPLAVAEAEAHLKQESTAAFRAKALRYAGAVSLFTAGAGLVTFSGLMQFSPHLILQIGAHLPPVALAILTSLHLTPVILAALAATGVGMVGAAAYLAYRTYYPAAPVVAKPASSDESGIGPVPVAATTPLSAKLLTGGLMASGLGLLGFSAATQFSPAFVLLTGLQLPPVALIALAAVGALLISIAVYRLINKTPANVAAPAVTNAAQPTDSCYQRIYQSMPSFCFTFSGKKKEETTLGSEARTSLNAAEI